ncbi:hypothetical protein E2C01_062644 [Portunus trituberculatus]|uniref:Uncharacterized protein n=1 Tax=Portunus trituberculatus TaxID=210409 RepID=A0A5B7HBP0_PORTR|nr:hypothetical protein [Portunus trituberculatus]
MDGLESATSHCCPSSPEWRPSQPPTPQSSPMQTTTPRLRACTVLTLPPRQVPSRLDQSRRPCAGRRVQVEAPR